MVSPDQKFHCNGQVTEWRYQGKNSRGFRAIVWRPVNDSATQFQIVGINDIPAGTANVPITYAVAKSQRIRVKSGDVIGWSFGNPVITYSEADHYCTRVRWLRKNQHDTLQTDQVLDFIPDVGKRECSISATVAEVNDSGEYLLYFMHKKVFFFFFFFFK